MEVFVVYSNPVPCCFSYHYLQTEGDELSEGDKLSPTSVTEDLESTAFLLASQLSDESNETVLMSDNIGNVLHYYLITLNTIKMMP